MNPKSQCSWRLLQSMGGYQAFSFMTLFLVFLNGAVGLNSISSIHNNIVNDCQALDRCEYRQAPSEAKGLSCSCDVACLEYDDCCIDARQFSRKTFFNPMKCFEVKNVGGVYMKDSCSPSYDGPDVVKVLCEGKQFGDQADPLASMPFTDPSTGVTYKNFHCSLCNDNSDSVKMWKPQLECPFLPLFNASGKITDDYVLQRLTTNGDAWGLYLDDDNDEVPFFHECEISAILPAELQDKVRLCTPNLISDCLPTWEDEDVREMCQSYAGARYELGSGDGYRNVHCAICNGVNETQLSCQAPEEEDFFRFAATHSFAMLVDVGGKTGERVGLIRLCKPGYIFDPFFQRCRGLSCLPGFVRRGRRCYPKIRTYLRKVTTSPKVFVPRKQSIAPTQVSSTQETPVETTSISSLADLHVTPIRAASPDTFKTVESVLVKKLLLSTTSKPSTSSVADRINIASSTKPSADEQDDFSKSYEVTTTSSSASENVADSTTGQTVASTP